MKDPQAVRDWIGTVESARERHDAAAHAGFYCCRAGRATDGLEFFEYSIALHVEIRDELQHQQALRLSATFMRAAAVDLMDLGDESTAAQIASRIPDSLIQDEAFWLMSTVKEQQLRVAVEPEVMHPWFVLCEADTSSLPNAEIYELLPADSPLRERILSLEVSDFDSEELAQLWLDLDSAVLESWLSPIVRSS
ncbi:MAG UNVERIFIED_CONTAM: hypothetical protein LVR18_40330 [Planctomycetaceae bacterium]